MGNKCKLVEKEASSPAVTKGRCYGNFHVSVKRLILEQKYTNGCYLFCCSEKFSDLQSQGMLVLGLVSKYHKSKGWQSVRGLEIFPWVLVSLVSSSSEHSRLDCSRSRGSQLPSFCLSQALSYYPFCECIQLCLSTWVLCPHLGNLPNVAILKWSCDLL